MSGGTGNFILENAEAFALRIVRLHTSYFTICAGNRLVLRAVDVDGVGGLTAVKMVKYTAKG